MASETSPLLTNGATAENGLLHPEGPQPTLFESYRNLLLGKWLNVLLVSVPLSFASHFAGWGSTPTFILSFIAIVPLASLLGDCTEQCAVHLSESVGALLNATFGNAVELIVGVLALLQNETRIVQTSLLGSILSNVLLVLGCSFFAAGICRPESSFQTTAAQNSVSVLLLGMSTLIIPAAYHVTNSSDGEDSDLEGLLFISRGTAIILLFAYAAYLYFQLHTHSYLFQTAEVATEAESEKEEPTMSLTASLIGLLVVTVITSFCADYLVESVDEFAHKFNISKAFIGLILIPIVGNAAEHVTSVWMAVKGKMEITIGVSVGSSIQIAVGLIPALVLVGWATGHNLTLYFGSFETLIFFVSCFLVQNLLVDGKSNYLEGLMLICLYLVIAISFLVS